MRRVVIAVRPALGIVSQAVEQILNALRRVSGLSHEASPKPISYFFADCGVVGCIEVAGISVRHSTSSTRNLPMTPRERLGLFRKRSTKVNLIHAAAWGNWDRRSRLTTWRRGCGMRPPNTIVDAPRLPFGHDPSRRAGS
jgi:hypothetical protein